MLKILSCNIYFNMESFYIVGGRALEGQVKIDSAKNALLPILAGCIMVEDEVLLNDVPRYSDVLAMCEIIGHLGGKVKWSGEDLYIDTRGICACDVPNELAKVVRSSIFTLGPILSRLKKAKVAYPGGCDIGLRPIDIHLAGLRQLGNKIIEKNGYIYASGEGMRSGDVMLSFPSVGATENIMMNAVLTDGESRIFNPAREPEIVDLQNFLNACGAYIQGAGGNVVAIKGVKKLHGCQYKVMPDRIESGTFLIAGAMCGGEIELEGALKQHNQSLLSKLTKTACQIRCYDDKIILKQTGRAKSFLEVETAVYPGFPTDLQAQMMALASISEGYSMICENLFEARFKHVGELVKMGCDIRCKNGICVICGRENIYGADVNSPDLRGGAALVLAGLVAQGYTTVNNVYYIDRGYYRLEDKLSSLGAMIKRIESEEKTDYNW